MIEHYILKDKKPVLVSMMEWAKWFEHHENRVVAQTEYDSRLAKIIRFFTEPFGYTIRPIMVSTVFLGIDHGFGSSKPVLFETMVFGGKHDGHTERCCTWGEAVLQHEKVCLKVQFSS